MPVARLLAGVEVKPVDEALGRSAGVLPGWRGTSDAVDAAVMCLAQDGDDILTSDVGDLALLANRAGVHVELLPV